MCEIEGCEEKRYAKGFCKKHYQRNYRYGDPNYEPHRVERVCEIEGCERKHSAKGLCAQHYKRLWKHGDPNVKLRNTIKGIRTHYSHQHRWLRQHFGSASLHDCSICGGPATDWAFIREWCPDDEVMWGKTSKGFPAPFSQDAGHYLTLCKSDHNRLDKGISPEWSCSMDA